MIGDLGPSEVLLILVVVLLLFGAKKLPELARGSGRALRIFKAETQGLRNEDEGAAPATLEHAASAPTTAEQQTPATEQ